MENIQNALDQVQQSLVNITGAINRQIEQLNVIEARLDRLENANTPRVIAQSGLVAPSTEAELLAIGKLPDCVRDLQIFEGNPIQYVSWVHNVESILSDYEIIKEKPLYRAILKHIRQKIRGEADNALVSYNIFDETWVEIKKCLSLHYADKRDIQSLENQLINMRQGRDHVSEFYSKVNHQLSLIINKIKIDDFSEDGKNALVENYRSRALDVFIRGLPQNLSSLVKVQKPLNLPEAYAACIELQNMDFRKSMYNEDTSVRRFRSDYQQNVGGRNVNSGSRNYQGQINNQRPAPLHYQGRSIPQKPLPMPNVGNFPDPQRQLPTPMVMAPFSRPAVPNPLVPMDVDSSIQSKRVNYMNRPSLPDRPSNVSSNIPRKNQRLFNIETGRLETLQEDQTESNGNNDEEYFQQLENELTEVNFMR